MIERGKNMPLRNLLISFLLVSCGINGGGRPTISPNTNAISIALPQEVNCLTSTITGLVYIQSYTYSPPYETILSGEIVKWINNDIVTHTVTSGSGSQDNRIDLVISPSEARCVKFQSKGLVNYYCKIFPSLTGAINVQ